MLGYKPGNISLYKTALTHRSIRDGADENNERLEYLGDAVLSSLIADYLFKRYPYKEEGFLTEMRSKMVNRQQLNEIALRRGQTLAQMALVWLLKDPRVSSVLIGASSVAQLDDNVAALKNMKFSTAELTLIEQILSGEKKRQGTETLPDTESAAEEKTSSRGDFIQNLAKKYERRF